MARRNRRFVFIIIVLHLCVLFVIYKCIPSHSQNEDSLDGKNHQRASGNDVIQDPYRLNWDQKGHVFYKKVKGHSGSNVNDDLGEDIAERPQTCDYKNRNTRHFVKISNDFFLYSSYFDNRTGLPEIRSIAIYKTNSTSVAEKLIWCHFEIPNSGRYPAYATSRAKFYEMCENHNKHYGGYIVSCLLPSNIKTTPSSMKIGRGDSRQESLHNSKEICITSRDKKIVRRKLNFGVCVPPVHGLVKPKDLIEFIELHRLLGAEIFTLYLDSINNTISNEIMKTIQYYVTKNIINLVQWDLPVSKKRIWYHGQSLAMNDCLYRNMADFRYVTFIDLDEMLVPNGDEMTSWLDLVRHLKITENSFDTFSGYTFQSTFFDSNFSKKVLSRELKTGIQTIRTEQFSIFRNKMMVRPERVFEIGIHHVSKSWPESEGFSVYKVKPEVARIHHYRKCVLEFGIHCRSRVYDDVVQRKFGQNLANNFRKTLYDIMP